MVKIQQLEVENLKRIKACVITPTDSGLTIIGGKNGQGKTSALDAIAWALGGEKYRPSSPTRGDSVIPPRLSVTLSNGIKVERSGKNSSLKVTDQSGKKSGQQLLNEFISQLAIDLPKFMNATSKEKASTLLQIIGVGEQLFALDQEESTLYNERLAIGRIADQKKKFTEEMPSFEGVPETPVSALELIQQQQKILALNGENQRKRDEKERYERELTAAQIAFDEAKKRFEQAEKNAQIARSNAEDLEDEPTDELEKNLSEIESLNMKIRANLDREKAAIDAEQYSKKYDAITSQIEGVRLKKTELLNNAAMPLDGLSVENGELVYNGQKWDCMSGSEQLIVGTAIARALNPACGFVLLDKLEQMDLDTLKAFGDWTEQEGLQVIATRVSTGDECSIIIEDGETKEKPAPASVPAWVPKGV